MPQNLDHNLLREASRNIEAHLERVDRLYDEMVGEFADRHSLTYPEADRYFEEAE